MIAGDRLVTGGSASGLTLRCPAGGGPRRPAVGPRLRPPATWQLADRAPALSPLLLSSSCRIVSLLIASLQSPARASARCGCAEDSSGSASNVPGSRAPNTALRRRVGGISPALVRKGLKGASRGRARLHGRISPWAWPGSTPSVSGPRGADVSALLLALGHRPPWVSRRPLQAPGAITPLQR